MTRRGAARSIRVATRTERLRRAARWGRESYGSGRDPASDAAYLWPDDETMQRAYVRGWAVRAGVRI